MPRRRHALSLLKKNRLDAFWVSKLENVRFLTGFTGSAGAVLLTPSASIFITDSRYATQARREVSASSVQILRKGETILDRIVRLAIKRKTTRLGFEPLDLSYQSYRDLKTGIAPRRLVPVQKGVEALRMVKSEEEVAKLLSAVRRAERAFRSVRKRVVAGRSEREIALAMEGVMRRLGASRVAFDLIVASGPRSAMPHGLASGKKIQTGDLVVIDFGAECDGYFSDMTRTLYAGKRLTGTKRTIFEVVRAAQEAAILRVKPGRTFGEIDKAARTIIGKAGFGAYFGHGTGHGIGLEVHERPYVAPKNQVLIEEGMVFTIEPGIYIPEVGGVRIEDMVLATADGCQVLTGLPRDWKN